mmetsp:Transcript_6247/g.11438  ORF Transcript_6247/g.11438 Transcript_6247/m.11438 type:complete len:202 (+) Transcript_6247:1098-1703(+)
MSSSVTSSPSWYCPLCQMVSLGSQDNTPTTSITSFNFTFSRPLFSYTFTRQGNEPRFGLKKLPLPLPLLLEGEEALLLLLGHAGHVGHAFMSSMTTSFTSSCLLFFPPTSPPAPPALALVTMAVSSSMPPASSSPSVPATHLFSPGTATQKSGLLSHITVSVAKERSSPAKSSYLVVCHSLPLLPLLLPGVPFPFPTLLVF